MQSLHVRRNILRLYWMARCCNEGWSGCGYMSYGI